MNPEPGSPRRLARWRIAAAVVVLAALAGFTGMFAPVYFRNMELQRYVGEVARRDGNQARPDDLLKTWVLEKASQLELPVKADNVQVRRSAGGVRIEVRYFVRVNLPGYTVDLHFYPGAGSR